MKMNCVVRFLREDNINLFYNFDIIDTEYNS